MASGTERSAWSRVVATLLALVLPLSTISFWAVYTVTNTDRWVATLQPLATNPTITNYIAEEGAATIVTELHVESRIKNSLPPAAGFLATTITTELQSTITKALSSALQSSTFQSLWEKENRYTHSTAVAILSGDENGNISTARKIILNVTPAITSAIDQLDKQGITFLDPLKKRLKVDQVLALKLIDDKELQKAQTYFHIATTLKWILPLLSVLLGALVVLLARPRRRGFRRLSLVVMFASAVSYGLLRIGITLATPLAPTPPDVTKAILNAITHYLGREFLLLTALGACGLLIVWVTGPSRGATSLRRHVAGASRAVWRGIAKGSQQIAHTDWKGWSAANRANLSTGLRVADVVVAVFAVISLLFWVSSFWGLVAIVAIVAAYYWAAQRIHAVVDTDRQLALTDGGDATPDAEMSDATK